MTFSVNGNQSVQIRVHNHKLTKRQILCAQIELILTLTPHH